MNAREKIPIVKPVIPQSERVDQAVQNILQSGMLTKGPYLEEFEAAVAERLGVEHAVGVSSCTTGLMLAFRAMDLKGEVIVPSFTFMATVGALVWAGATPVFADSDPATKNVDPRSVIEKINPRTTAIVAVHNFGNPAAIDQLEEIARQHKLRLIFDAAHAMGSRYGDKPIGPQGHAQVFSLSPTKLVIAGEGGIVATNDAELAVRLRQAREYGNDGRYDTVLIGLNGRMPEISALLGRESLNLLDVAIENRNRYARLYKEQLDGVKGISFQRVNDNDLCTYKDLCINVDAGEFGLSRDDLSAALAAENIETRKYYDPPAHLQTAYRQYAEGDLPGTLKLSRESLSLPIWSEMDEQKITLVCDAIIRAAGGAMRIAPSSSRSSHRNEAQNSTTEAAAHPRIRNLLEKRRNGHHVPTNGSSADHEQVSSFLRDKRVLVTGAGGSIGSELARQLATYPLGELVLLDRAEHGIFLLERELAEAGAKMRVVIADVSDRVLMDSVFSRFTPEIIFHAAAHKHVPLMESNVAEAVRNNILGTRVIGDIAGKHNASSFVLISTDKAVRPTSVMGATKRVAELVVQELDQAYDTRYSAVRFGNVIDSTGSVTTIWRDQIERGLPLTITDPVMERYFMTIPEASDLVLRAGAMGKGGEIFVLDMDRPVRIVELAQEVIRRSGRPENSVEIVFTGARPGEKLREELQTEGARLTRTQHSKIFAGKISANGSGLVGRALQDLESLYRAGDETAIRKFLNALLPEAALPVDR